MKARHATFALLFVVGTSGCEEELIPMPAFELAGRVVFEARLPTPQGASRMPEARPARFVAVEVVGKDGDVLVDGTTDAEGHFELSVPAGGVKLLVRAHLLQGHRDIMVSRDAAGERAHVVEVILHGAPLPLEVTALVEAREGAGGAFHILDTMLVGVDAAEAWTGRELPPFFAYWGRGRTTRWSYYLGETPAGSGRYAFEILGGQPSRHETTDTDEHDEAIIIHELGHLVMDLNSTHSSTGGLHPPGVLVNPGLAWEEGRVSWFATAVRNDPLYQDTVGVEPEGELRVDWDFSRRGDAPQSIGSELTVSEVLWDLADGAGDIDDADHDGVALGAEALIRAQMAMAEEEGAYPCLPSFLRFLIRSDRVDEEELRGMLAATGQPDALLPADDVSVWPVDLELPAEIMGHLDGVTDPAPSGGPAQPGTGLDATAVYRFFLPHPVSVAISLSIEGSGQTGDQSNLDLELRDIHAQMLEGARTEEPEETIGPVPLEPGWYVVYVRDNNEGSRASYTLRIQEG